MKSAAPAMKKLLSLVAATALLILVSVPVLYKHQKPFLSSADKQFLRDAPGEFGDGQPPNFKFKLPNKNKALSAAVPAMAQEAVSVDFAADAGAPTYRASGFLHGFSVDGSLPESGMVSPLKARLHRSGLRGSWAVARRVESQGMVQQVVLADVWGYGGKHPGDDGEWREWEERVYKTVLSAKQAGLSIQWDIWNEPDHPQFWQRSPEQFYETWRRAWLQIRQADSQAVIVGPSWSDVHPGMERFAEFLSYAKRNGVPPDYVSWHFPPDAVKEAGDCRALLKSEGISAGLQINEYVLKDEQYPAKTAWHIARIERSGVDASCHAVWADEDTGTLDGLLTAAGATNGTWWVYRRYADITGHLLATTPSGNIELAAGTDSGRKTALVLLGSSNNFTGTVKLSLSHLDRASYLINDGKLPAIIEAIADVKLERPTVIFKGDLQFNGQSLEIPVPWEDSRSAYVLRLGIGWRE